MPQKIKERETIEAELGEFLEEIESNYSNAITQVILFGSVARGDFTEDSDIDVLVVCDNNKAELKSKLIGTACDLLLKYGKYISVKVYDLNRFQYLRHLETPFFKNVLKEGQIVWKRKSL